MNDDLQTTASINVEGGPALVAIFLTLLVVYGIPAMRIVGRTGLNRWWGVLAAVPFANVVALWVFAFIRWPNEEQ